MNSKFYITTRNKSISFIQNTADYGGAIFVTDDTYKVTCKSTQQTITAASESECFFQSISVISDIHPLNFEKHIHFFHNLANIIGEVLFVRLKYSSRPGFISDILNQTTSKAVRICFCRDYDVVDCDYQPKPVEVMKGQYFTIPVVAVDYVNHTVGAKIRSYLSNKESRLSKGQKVQNVSSVCTNLNFRVYSRMNQELLTLYAVGPCNDTGISQRQLRITFLPCKCAVGFQPQEAELTKCKCICDLRIQKYISDCNSLTNLVQRKGNSWITVIASYHNHSYFIYLNCPWI